MGTISLRVTFVGVPGRQADGNRGSRDRASWRPRARGLGSQQALLHTRPHGISTATFSSRRDGLLQRSERGRRERHGGSQRAGGSPGFEPRSVPAGSHLRSARAGGMAAVGGRFLAVEANLPPLLRRVQRVLREQAGPAAGRVTRGTSKRPTEKIVPEAGLKGRRSPGCGGTRCLSPPLLPPSLSFLFNPIPSGRFIRFN